MLTYPSRHTFWVAILDTCFRSSCLCYFCYCYSCSCYFCSRYSCSCYFWSRYFCSCVTFAPVTFAQVLLALVTFDPVLLAPVTFAPVLLAPATFAPVTFVPVFLLFPLALLHYFCFRFAFSLPLHLLPRFHMTSTFIVWKYLSKKVHSPRFDSASRSLWGLLFPLEMIYDVLSIFITRERK